MEILAAIIIMISGGASLPGLVNGDAQYANLVKTRRCDKNHYIKTLIFTKGNMDKPFEPKVYISCDQWFQKGK